MILDRLPENTVASGTVHIDHANSLTPIELRDWYVRPIIAGIHRNIVERDLGPWVEIRADFLRNNTEPSGCVIAIYAVPR